MELCYPPPPPDPPEKRRLAAHIAPKYILPRDPYSLKSGPVQFGITKCPVYRCRALGGRARPCRGERRRTTSSRCTDSAPPPRPADRSRERTCSSTARRSGTEAGSRPSRHSSAAEAPPHSSALQEKRSATAVFTIYVQEENSEILI